jgi:hypothetical protein
MARFWPIKKLFCLLPFLFAALPDAYGCIRVDPRYSPMECAHDADVVFVGTVIGIDTSEHNRAVSFKVGNQIKGELPEKIVVWTNPRATSCGYLFREPTEYLVYAENKGELRVPSCGRTKPSAGAGLEIQELLKADGYFGGPPEKVLLHISKDSNNEAIINYVGLEHTIEEFKAELEFLAKRQKMYYFQTVYFGPEPEIQAEIERIIHESGFEVLPVTSNKDSKL